MPDPIQPEYQAYTPSGVVDSIDGNTARKGAMALLQNLIFDPETAGLVICRAAAYDLTVFPGFSSPGYVSVMKCFGNLVIGMLATAKNPGFDEPFIYNLTTGAFTAITGVTSSNVPTSPATTGAWTPPTVDMIGGYIVFTHPGFNGSGNGYFGWIDSSSAWSSGNTSTNNLPAVPTTVVNFYNRAYFTCGNLEYFSDVLAPTTMSNSTNFLTVGGTDGIVATTGQPFFTTQTGGILGALLLIKNAQIWQVTGDLTGGSGGTSTLALNKLSDGIGTAAPRSVVNTPMGVMLVAQDGIRTVDLTGQVSEANPDLAIPFLNPIVPSRISAAYNVGYYRICTNYLLGGVLENVEFWYSTKRQAWCGPHTLAYDGITSALGTFLLTGPSFKGQILQSNVIPNEQTDFYNELGVNLTWAYQHSLIPEFRAMPGWSLQQASIFLGFQLQQTITASLLDQAGNALGTYSLVTPFLAPINATNWQLNYTASTGGMGNILIPSRHTFALTGTSSMNLSLGSIFALYQYQPDINALDAADSVYMYTDLDFGLVTDPKIYYNLDWGGVSDSVNATIDFETNGSHPGNP